LPQENELIKLEGVENTIHVEEKKHH